MSLPAIDLAVFHENGYVRKQCRVTSLWFWTTDAERDTCGDTSEDEYTFIGAPLISGFDQRGKALKDAMREAFRKTPGRRSASWLVFACSKKVHKRQTT